MIEFFLPNENLRTIYEINLDKLISKNIKGVILDLDNTLVPYKTRTVDINLKKWINRVKKRGIKTIILSNSTFRGKSAKNVAKTLGVPIITNGLKPLPFRFRKALKILNLQPDEVVVIGDQILTDILGANLLKIYNIKVEPISKEEFITTSFNRIIERFIIKILKRRGLYG